MITVADLKDQTCTEDNSVLYCECCGGTYEICCIRSRGGKKPLWHAWHKNDIGSAVAGYAVSTKNYTFCGAGNSADNAIKDLSKAVPRV